MNDMQHNFLCRSVSILGADGHVRKWREIEGDVIDWAISACNGNFSAAAAALGTSRGLIYRRKISRLERALDAASDL